MVSGEPPVNASPGNESARRFGRYAAFLPALFFPIAALIIGLRNPSIFKPASLAGCLPIVVLAVLAPIAAARLSPRSSDTVRRNLDGLLLFALFTTGYLLLGSLFNKPDINTNNIFFAADSWSWYRRMASSEGWVIGTRAIHPLTYLLFRPLISGMSFLTFGSRFLANLVLLAAAGGACVFLAWKIVARTSGHATYSILWASVLGLSASHLIFASVIETYIFSSLGLLVFLWLVIEGKPAYLLVLAGVATFGITITNAVQQLIAASFVRRNLKQVVLLFLAIGSIALALNLVSKVFYPLTEYFFLPRNLTGEQRFARELSLKRAALLSEDMLIYGVAAPQPYVRTRNGVPGFGFLRGAITDYIWFGWPALFAWAATLLAALYRFFARLAARPGKRLLPTALLLCLLLNFVIHIRYGGEPFLYSADWAYAVILFVAVVLGDLAWNKWFHALLLALTGFLFMNNLWLLYRIAWEFGGYVALLPGP